MSASPVQPSTSQKTTPRPPKVVVVGGGLAGLAAAVAAADGGAEVVLYERAPRLGGATWSFERNGRWFDNGQHVFMRCCTEYRAFLDRLGVAEQAFLQDRLSVPVVRPGHRPAFIARTAMPAPLHLGRSLLRYRPLSMTQRWRAIRTALALRRLDPEDPATDQTSFGQWLRARGESSRAIAGLWDLICLPTVNLRADDASLSLAVKVFRTGLLDRSDAADLGWTRVPLAALHADAAAEAISAQRGTINLRSSVDAIDRGPTVKVDDQWVQADAVVLAVPHDAVDALVPPGTVVGQKELVDLGVSPIVNVQFVFDRKVMDLPFAAALDSPVQFVFDRTEAALGKAPAGDEPSAGNQGEQVVSVSLSAAFSEIGDRPADLIERYRSALTQLFPRAGQAEVLDAVVTREHRATFAGRPDTKKLRPGPVTAIDGVYLAGAWIDTGWPATMEGAVRSGYEAARLSLEYCQQTTGLAPAQPERMSA